MQGNFISERNKITGLSPVCSCSFTATQELWREKAFPDLSALLQLHKNSTLSRRSFMHHKNMHT